MPKVLFVVPVLQPAGAERIVAHLACRLPKLGFETSVVCLEDERAPVGLELAAAGIPVTGLHRSRRRTLGCAKALAEIFHERQPEIVHAHLFHANIAARYAKASLKGNEYKRLRVITTVHVAERRFRPWQFYLDRKTAEHAQCEVCVSKAVADFQYARTKLPREFFRVIENGIDLSRFAPADRSINRAVVSVGRLDPQKDFPTLLKAWKTVSSRFPTLVLSIAGDGPERERLKRLCKSLSLKRVEFLGFVDDVPGLLKTATLYIQSSAWEGFGLAVAEAMACALPVVVTDADSLPEIVTHGRTGLVAPKSDPEALAAAMIDLLNDPQRAAKLGAAAREEAMGRFSVDRMVDDYSKLYKELMHQ
jgi:glycosyltransferase involved in cell wall biosynthesis